MHGRKSCICFLEAACRAAQHLLNSSVSVGVERNLGSPPRSAKPNLYSSVTGQVQSTPLKPANYSLTTTRRTQIKLPSCRHGLLTLIAGVWVTLVWVFRVNSVNCVGELSGGRCPATLASPCHVYHSCPQNSPPTFYVTSA